MNSENEIKKLQVEIMKLGSKLCGQLDGKIDAQNLKYIAQYFDVNEYGEAVELLNHYIAEDNSLFDCSDEFLLSEINTKMNKVAKLWGEV